MARRIEAGVRESDTVARIGSDEIVVLLRNIDDANGALGIAEKIRLALARPFEHKNHALSVSASIGLALYPEHGYTEIGLAKNADTAMYWAKKSGGNMIRLFDLDNEQERNSG